MKSYSTVTERDENVSTEIAALLSVIDTIAFQLAYEALFVQEAANDNDAGDNSHD